MWTVSETLTVGASPETVWHVVTDGEPRSTPQVTWWFRLHPAETGGTAVEHHVAITPPEIGAEEMTEFFERTDRVGGIRAGMLVTLQNLAAAVDGSD